MQIRFSPVHWHILWSIFLLILAVCACVFATAHFFKTLNASLLCYDLLCFSRTIIWIMLESHFHPWLIRKCIVGIGTIFANIWCKLPNIHINICIYLFHLPLTFTSSPVLLHEFKFRFFLWLRVLFGSYHRVSSLHNKCSQLCSALPLDGSIIPHITSYWALLCAGEMWPRCLLRWDSVISSRVRLI